MNMPILERTPLQPTDHHTKPLLINGAWHTTKQLLTSCSPATGDVLGQVCVGGTDEIDLAIQAAHQAFPAWRAAGEAARQAVLQRLHDVLAERRPGLTDLISHETGKPPFEALSTDVVVTMDALAYYAKRGRRDLHQSV
jgi:acyl-CoA reductase-like NAD-dependent aldehyde dehydrogenase